MFFFRYLETFLRNGRWDLFKLLTYIERWCTAYALISNFQCSHHENTQQNWRWLIYYRKCEKYRGLVVKKNTKQVKEHSSKNTLNLSPKYTQNGIPGLEQNASVHSYQSWINKQLTNEDSKINKSLSLIYQAQ